MKPQRRMPMPKRSNRSEREELLERKLYHLSQLVAAIMYDKCDNPEQGLSYAERDVLDVDPKDLICELVPDADLQGQRRIVVKIKSLVTPTA